MPFKTVLVKGLGKVKFPGDMADDAIAASIKNLDMSEAARMARAKEQGFDVYKTLYHGSPFTGQIDEFITGGQGGFRRNGNAFGDGVYVSTDPKTANEFAGSGQVLPIYSKGDLFSPSGEVIDSELAKTLDKIVKDELDEGEMSRLSSDLGGYRGKYVTTIKEDGKDFYETHKKNWEFFGGLERTKPKVKKDGDRFIVEYTDFNSPPTFEGKTKNEVINSLIHVSGHAAGRVLDKAGFKGVKYSPMEAVIFDPKNIRSKHAAFNPDAIDSPSLLASSAPLAVSAGLGATAGLAPNDAKASVTGKIEGPAPGRENIAKVSEFIDRHDDIVFDDLLGGVTSWLNKLSYDDKLTFKDRLMAALDLM